MMRGGGSAVAYEKCPGAVLAELSPEVTVMAKEFIQMQTVFDVLTSESDFFDSTCGKMLVRIIGNYLPILMKASISIECTGVGKACDGVVFICMKAGKTSECILIANLFDIHGYPTVDFLSSSFYLDEEDCMHLKAEHYRRCLLIYRQTDSENNPLVLLARVEKNRDASIARQRELIKKRTSRM